MTAPARHEDLREVAEQLATEAAESVRRRRLEIFGEEVSGAAAAGKVAVRVKSTATDPVTVVDTETEQFLRARLAHLRPGDAILGEEGGQDGGELVAGALRWVIDPIDGTVNFLYGIPAFAVSVAAQRDGASVAGAVADVSRLEVYSASAGGGAYLTAEGVRRRLRCSAVTDLSQALLGTGFGYASSRRAAQAALLSQILPRVRDVRRIGAASLDLCSVAAGRLDVYYEHGLHVWDWAAGALIAAEAGAFVELPADDKDESGAVVVAAAPGVAAQLMAALERCGGLNAL